MSQLQDVITKQVELDKKLTSLMSTVDRLATQISSWQETQSRQINDLHEGYMVQDIVQRQTSLEENASRLTSTVDLLAQHMTSWQQQYTEQVEGLLQVLARQQPVQSVSVPHPVAPKVQPVAPKSTPQPSTSASKPVLDTPKQSMERLTGALSEEAAANTFWSEEVKLKSHFMSGKKKVVMFGAPISEGQGMTGVDQMAEHMRKGGLQKVIRAEGWELEDMGDLPLKEVIEMCQRSGEPQKHPEPKIHMCFEIGRALEKVYDGAYQAARRGAFVLNVGGDHSVATASIAGVMKARKDLCVIWVDAHGDCNTPETSPSGNYHGMPAAHVLGWFRRQVPGFDWLKTYLPEHRFCFIGLRDIDDTEAVLMRNSGIHIFSMKDVDRYGIGRVVDMALRAVNPHNDRPIHLSLDIDALDPIFAPGTGTKSKGGLTYREARYLCEELARTNLLGSMDIVEVNTDLDKPVAERLHGDDPNLESSDMMTVQLANELVAYAIGKKLL